MRDTLDQLASEVSAARLSRPEVEGLLYRLSGQQRRLFLRLCRGPADTIALRVACTATTRVSRGQLAPAKIPGDRYNLRSPKGATRGR